MIYRREIDGLRALAVVPVILFHAGASLVPGGFLGVDIFFVISGYLIIGLMLEELKAGIFSLRQFYIRRARRILPALYAVVLATIPLAYLWLLPAQYQDYSESLLAVILFASNLLFWRESGYFAPDSAEKPLLHTWSLGVEEQFYFLMPLALLLLWRFVQARTGIALLALAAVSLALCEMASRHMPAANFFLLPTRLWELALGGYVAWLHQRNGMRANNLLSLVGMSLIGFALFGLHEEMRLPSLIPVVGTLLVLMYAAQSTWVARGLSAAPFAAIGLVSYSAYLWHHPLLAFAGVRGLPMQGAGSMTLLLIVTFALAALSWCFIEQPFRNLQQAAYIGGRRALLYAIAPAILIVAAGIHGVVTQGRIEHWKQLAQPSQVKAYELLKEAQSDQPYFDNGDCVFNISNLGSGEQERVTACAKKYGRGVAVFGDSHAINLFYMMKESAPREPFLVGITQGMCRPHSDTSLCYYSKLADYLKRYPDTFHAMLYTQAGFYLMQDRYGTPIDRHDVMGVPLDQPWPEFTPNENYIRSVKRYLIDLSVLSPSRIIWLGAHMAPHVRKSVLVRMGCDGDFQPRPNQEATFRRLDAAIEKQLQGSTVEYRSQLDLMKFDMQQDLMNCDATFFKDGDHYSAAGEVRFAKRVTLPSVLGGHHE